MRNGVHQQQTPLTIFIFKYIDTGIILPQLPEVDETYVQCIANECHITEGMGTNENGLLYEGLLEKNAGEKKSGAGQYFTPRVLIDVMTRLMKPQPGERCNDEAVA